jgi:hypothetical protein
MLPILRENYNSVELAAKLISYGDASSIDKKLDPTPGVAHTFMMPEKDVCVFYHRDRGDDWFSCQPACYAKKELFDQPAFEYIDILKSRLAKEFFLSIAGRLASKPIISAVSMIEDTDIFFRHHKSMSNSGGRVKLLINR